MTAVNAKRLYEHYKNTNNVKALAAFTAHIQRRAARYPEYRAILEVVEPEQPKEKPKAKAKKAEVEENGS